MNFQDSGISNACFEMLPARQLSSQNTQPTQQDMPQWLSCATFEAKSSTVEKLCRMGNDLIFGIGIISLCTVPELQGLISSAAYLSIALATRKVASAILGYMVYPAARTSHFYLGHPSEIHIQPRIMKLENDGFILKKISIYKSGTVYDARIVTHSSTMKNGRWTINALGRGMSMENSIVTIARENFSNNSNTLLINGPSVGSSGGYPTRYQMGAGFEAGIQLLEDEIKATHIIMKGFSFGGGMMAEAILNHDFTKGLKQKINYLSIADRTFSRLSTIVEAVVNRGVTPILFITGMELDGVAAAKKLSELDIKQIIIQHAGGSKAGDGIILDKASLAYELHKYPDLKGKIFIESSDLRHSHLIPKDIEEILEFQVKSFLDIESPKA
jgi:hypothetical protein